MRQDYPAPDQQVFGREDGSDDDGLKALNLHLGARIRSRRKQLNMSQTQLGQAVRLTFQQVQKYEHGSNRISAARLFEMAQVLKVPVSFFFDGLSAASQFSEEQEEFREGRNDLFERPEAAELVRAFYRIREPAVQDQILALLRTLQPAG